MSADRSLKLVYECVSLYVYKAVNNTKPAYPELIIIFFFFCVDGDCVDVRCSAPVCESAGRTRQVAGKTAIIAKGLRSSRVVDEILESFKKVT